MFHNCQFSKVDFFQINFIDPFRPKKKPICSKKQQIKTVNLDITEATSQLNNFPSVNIFTMFFNVLIFIVHFAKFTEAFDAIWKRV